MEIGVLLLCESHCSLDSGVYFDSCLLLLGLLELWDSLVYISGLSVSRIGSVVFCDVLADGIFFMIVPDLAVAQMFSETLR